MKTEICPIGNTHLELTRPRQWQKIFSGINAFLRSALYKIKEFEGRIFTVAGSSYCKWVEGNKLAMVEEIGERMSEGCRVLGGGFTESVTANFPIQTIKIAENGNVVIRRAYKSDRSDIQNVFSAPFVEVKIPAVFGPNKFRLLRIKSDVSAENRNILEEKEKL